MAKVIPESTQLSKLKPIANKKSYSYSRIGEYLGSSKSRYTCTCFVCTRVWDAKLSNLLLGKGCPDCGRLSTISKKSKPESYYIESMTSDNSNTLEVIERVGEFEGSKTQYKVRCLLDGYEWVATANNLTSNKKGCAMCAKRPAWDGLGRERQIEDIPNVNFVNWVDKYKNIKSRATFRCDLGHEWESSINNLVNKTRVCPTCSLIDFSISKRVPEEVQLEKLTSIISGRYSIDRIDEYIGNVTKYKCVCLSCSHEWDSALSTMQSGSGCPSCAPYGFQLDKPGTLYVLRSVDGRGIVKVGITNKLKQRHQQLTKSTPFDWECIELVHNENGASIAELEKYLHSRMNRVKFDEPFDGYTEWMEWDPNLLVWLEEYRSKHK